METKSTEKNGMNIETNNGLVKMVLLVITVLFFLLTALAVWQNGVLGIFEHQFKNFGGIQVWVDLFIALSIFMVWMWRDAKATNRNPWPWIILTLAAGSFGPLFYLLFRNSNRIE
ncbi:MAG TPA: DUF2834 domain-containing protein [Leptospiraceae bacterium]|nr:DUF2834 domain-containing protein [Leptospiraceae bacterium]HRG74821.1 DUF2834 domain-containing protein [Leptospiraceae bacterium]